MTTSSQINGSNICYGIHRPGRELSPVKSNHGREDGKGIQNEEYQTEHRHNCSYLKQIHRREWIGSIGNQIGWSGQREQEGTAAAASYREEKGEWIESTFDSDSNDNRNHDGGTGGVGDEGADDYHENGNDSDR